MHDEMRRKAIRIGVALVLFAAAMAVQVSGVLGARLDARGALAAEFALFLVPYLVAGCDVIAGAVRDLVRGRAFHEDLLMTIATVGAFALVLFPEAEPHMAEGAAVMLFFQVGELFQSYAVGRSRASIAAMMDIAPVFANLLRDGELVQVPPAEVPAGSLVLVKPGERVPLDGVVVEGASQLDTAALTGEAAPRQAGPGDEVLSGCVNLTGALTLRTTRPYGDSTVSRILELVENAAEKKTRTETFIRRFARVYTPTVTCAAALIALAGPVVMGGSWADWVQRGLIFLVVSCPCALVISVPLSYFGGIGAASRRGVLVKGSNYLEALSKAEVFAFDKTGTLTQGRFTVVAIHVEGTTANAENPVGAGLCPVRSAAEDERSESLAAEDDACLFTQEAALLEAAACAELFSTHPIAAALREAHGRPIDPARVAGAEEIAGRGAFALVDGVPVLVGSARLMEERGVVLPESGGEGDPHGAAAGATLVHVAVNGLYAGRLVVADAPKADAREAVAALREAGARRVVMLSGDREPAARSAAQALGIDEFRAELLPQDKVAEVERLLAEGGRVAFVGDGINDAPVLMRADVGIAMGALGSDAAIEAADVVLMNDNPADIALAVRIARRTSAIVRQNIVLALGVKFAVLALAALGMANLWLAVFADVGVSVLAITNALRTLGMERKRRQGR